MNNYIFKIASFIGLVLVAGIMISAVELKKSADIKEVKINILHLDNGNDLVTAEEIRLALDRTFGHSLVGIPLRMLDVDAIEKSIEEEPFVFTAEAFVDAEMALVVQISQREPILRIIDQNGTSSYLDRAGFKMPLSKHFTARVPVASGSIPAFNEEYFLEETHLIKDIYELAIILEKDEFLKPLIEQISVGWDKDFTMIPKVGKQKILIGTMENIDGKLIRLKSFYTEALKYEGWRKYKLLNLKYDKQLVAS